MKFIGLAALLLVLAACNSTNKSLLYAESATKDQEGMRVNLDAGTFSGGVNGQIENVGTLIRIPTNYKGAVPPGWSVYEEAPKSEEPAPPPSPSGE